jgi:hypothetical protein
MVLSVVLFVAVLVSNLQRPKVSVALLGGMTAAFCTFSLLLAKVLLQLRRDQRNAASVLQTAEHEFQQMAGNIQEIFWMIDADSKKALFHGCRDSPRYVYDSNGPHFVWRSHGLERLPHTPKEACVAV